MDQSEDSPIRPKLRRKHLYAFILVIWVYLSVAVLGSWVGMTVDNKERLICTDQYGGVYRVTVKGEVSVEKLNVAVTGSAGIEFRPVATNHSWFYAGYEADRAQYVLSCRRSF